MRQQNPENSGAESVLTNFKGIPAVMEMGPWAAATTCEWLSAGSSNHCRPETGAHFG